MAVNYAYQPPHFLVVGAGIAGLTTAIALARKGFSVSVVEKRSDNSEFGAGIQLGPNAIAVISKLGLFRQILDKAVEPKYLMINDSITGTSITNIKLKNRIERKYGYPYYVISRQDLHQTLKDTAYNNVYIRFFQPARLLDFQRHRQGFKVLIGKNTFSVDEFHVDAIIGADGINSNLRSDHELYKDCLPHHNDLIPSGYIAWRQLFDINDLPAVFKSEDVSLFLGNGYHIVSYPIHKGQQINMVIIAKDMRRKKARFENEHLPNLKNNEISGYLKLKKSAINELDKIKGCWTPWPLWQGKSFNKQKNVKAGALTLVGDAAHPVVPFLAQGAAFAMEDGYCLSEMIGSYYDNEHVASHNHAQKIEQLFRQYEEIRIPRWNKLQKKSASQVNIYHMPPVISDFRNIALTIFGQELMQWKTDWIYNWSNQSYDCQK